MRAVTSNAAFFLLSYDLSPNLRIEICLRSISSKKEKNTRKEAMYNSLPSEDSRRQRTFQCWLLHVSSPSLSAQLVSYGERIGGIVKSKDKKIGRDCCEVQNMHDQKVFHSPFCCNISTTQLNQ